jgi:hypothetical protein
MHGAPCLNTRRERFMTRRPILVAFVLSGLVAGCAEQPHEEVKSARDEEIEAAAKQREQTAEQSQEIKEEHAEDVYEERKEQAEGLPSETQQRVEAEAKMAEQHQIDRAKAMERLQKADARIAEARAKAANAHSVPLDLRTQINTAANQRDAAANDINKLQDVSPENWEAAMKRVDKQLDDLEMLVARALEKANSLQ